MDKVESVDEKTLDKMLYILQKDMLTLDEACLYLGIKPSFMYKLTSKRMIPHSVPNGKLIYFERQELDNWARKNRRKSIEELSVEAQMLLIKSNKSKA